MNAEQSLNYIERIIQGNPACHNTGWAFEIRRRAEKVRQEICRIRKFAMIKPGRVQEIELAHAQFLEDRLNELLDQYQKEG